MGVELEAGFIDAKYAAVMTAEYANILVSELVLEPLATIDCGGRGMLNPTNGTPMSDVGAGAGGATVGGAGAFNLGSLPGGDAVPQLYFPVNAGSRGGDRRHHPGIVLDGDREDRATCGRGG